MLRSCLLGRPSKKSEKDKPEDDRRLGIFELGPYAYEERMPASLAALLSSPQQAAAEEASPASIDLIRSLVEIDPNIQEGFLCHPGIQHISKANAEGNHLCGYRNIQMQVSYVRSAMPVSEPFKVLPSVVQIQDLIEVAWGQGFNPQGRLQTGGIKGTRKHIGTQEASTVQALFRSLGLTCKAHAFRDIRGGLKACDRLLDLVQNHFQSHLPPDEAGSATCKAIQTTAPPIFLQRPHHSLTIIGFETYIDGSRGLLVFDPSFPPKAKFLDAGAKDSRMGLKIETLKHYRKGRNQLKGFKGFEALYLVDGKTTE